MLDRLIDAIKSFYNTRAESVIGLKTSLLTFLLDIKINERCMEWVHIDRWQSIFGHSVSVLWHSLIINLSFHVSSITNQKQTLNNFLTPDLFL